jgi:TPP-dependent pyruvate/acetoin dehydrogenase alpha subunit
VPEDRIAAIEDRVVAEVEEAERFALASPFPQWDDTEQV